MLDIFIEGEVIDLAIPTEEFAKGDVWYKWLNDTNINKYLEQGVYPNTKKLQIEFFNSIGLDRLLFVIQNKKFTPLGVISLSFINQNKKTCDFALLMDSLVDIKISGIASLEAVSIIITHGFESLRMRRISAGQHINLHAWQQRLELLGFKLEGIHERKFIKGSEVSDSISIACLFSDYVQLVHKRSGKLWDGQNKMLQRIKSLPKESFRTEMDQVFANERKAYYEKIFNL